MKALRTFFLLVLFAGFLAGCSTLGVATPTSPSQELAYAYSTVTTLRQSAAAALQAGTITVAQAEQVLTLTDQARAALDAGQVALTAGDLATEAGKLQAASAILANVAAMLPATK